MVFFFKDNILVFTPALKGATGFWGGEKEGLESRTSWLFLKTKYWLYRWGCRKETQNTHLGFPTHLFSLLLEHWNCHMAPQSWVRAEASAPVSAGQPIGISTPSSSSMFPEGALSCTTLPRRRAAVHTCLSTDMVFPEASSLICDEYVSVSFLSPSASSLMVPALSCIPAFLSLPKWLACLFT